MLTLLLLSFLCAGASDVSAQARTSASYSGEFGSDAGSHFDQSDHEPEGPITGLRIRSNDRYIVSIQVRYGDSWSNTEGGLVGSPANVRLFLGEGIIQVLGRFGSHVEYLALRTNQGRIFAFGPSFGPGTFFTAEPSFPNMVLRSVSGRSGSSVDAIGFHWDMEP
ncbi:zymogen granule membrane protein 16-like [Heteronotia binoei]|uniref:zymogen granule membrane protein 16-like n=1 Tax=Heteronotia binoei TaxID=13085 RepID=UPI002931E810|nr:zymogen granule membrane protein 16-like [Heteronotia binoei]